MEGWRELAGILDYSFSDLGRVKRITKGPGKQIGLITQPRKMSIKNLPLKYLPRARRPMGERASLPQVRTARLLCWAWHGEPHDPLAEVVFHDGDKNNLRADNLGWYHPDSEHYRQRRAQREEGQWRWLQREDYGSDGNDSD